MWSHDGAVRFWRQYFGACGIFGNNAARISEVYPK